MYGQSVHVRRRRVDKVYTQPAHVYLEEGGDWIKYDYYMPSR